MKTTNRYISSLFLLIVLNIVGIRPVNAQDALALKPEQVSIIQYIMNERPVLVGLLTTAGLVPVLSGDNPYTLLAPPEQELAILKKESPDKIREVVSGFILKGSYQENDLKDGATVVALNGSKLKICRKNGTLVNGVLITGPNHRVKNGMVHQLQGML